MESPKFLGVYSGSIDGPNQGKTKVKKLYWYIWLMSLEQRYIVQTLDAKLDISPYFITPLQFNMHFKGEPEVKIPEPKCPNPKELHFYSRRQSELHAASHDVASTKPTYLKASEPLENELTAPNEQVGFSESSLKKTLSEKENLIVASGKATFEGQDNTTIVVPSTPIDKDAKDELGSVSSTQTTSQVSALQDLDDGADQALLLPKDSRELRLENAKAVRLDKELRQELANALDFWKKGKKGVASVKIDALLKRKDSFVPAHKHTFTECAIQLRKIRQFEPALAFALRCTEIAPEDSHAFFNAARMHYELKNYKLAMGFLEKTLAIEPTLAQAIKLTSVIEGILAKMSKKTVL